MSRLKDAALIAAIAALIVLALALVAGALWSISQDRTTSHPCQGTTGVYDLDGRPYTVPNDPRCDR